MLGFAVWEVELAAESSLLLRLPDRSFDPLSVRAALDDLDGLRRRLAQERHCNATESAARLGISVQRFKRVAAAARLAPVAEKDVHKYGKVLHVVYYRAGDVDALADHVRADAELRAAARVLDREQAARKAAATRKRNAELAAVVRVELERRKPAPDAGQIEVLTWAVALMRASSGALGPFRKLGHLDDPGIEQLTAVMRRAQLPRREAEALLEDILPRAVRATEDLADPEEVSAALGVPAWVVAEHVPHVGAHVPVAALRELAEDPPSWLLQARADIELQNAVVEVERQDAHRHAAVLDSAARAGARLSDASVAGLFGLSEDVVRALRPGSGHWKSGYVEQLMRRRPAWSLDEDAAWAEVERRQKREEARELRKWERMLGWRRTWARVFGVPLGAVPVRVGRPTPKAIAAAKAHPPSWATHVRRPDG
ncbi:hypothetical protein [Actinomadura bangladeshensis]|uniref:Uncharacterized protein n=1 Tax=Actinomadura bangladeshensis TaxID=453573 RepID=A0A4R4PBY1_9ACTN|nr:hypothetical protein [Actinomadura bangladeshensis]TDC19629.1 hypothetical protein E1284_02890 [Actinomadura bangladeshensis]